MRIRLTAALALVAGLIAAPALGQDISAERLADGIRTISSDAFGGRMPGTEGEAMTLAWLQAEYEAMGLEPGGADGQWLQPVDVSRYALNTARATWTAEGADPVHVLNLGVDAQLRSVANDGRASIQSAPLALIGYGIHAPERGWDDFGDLDVRSKIVVAIRGEPDHAAFSGPYASLYDTEFYKRAEAFRRGAIGFLTIGPVQGRGTAETVLFPGIHDMELLGSVSMPVVQKWVRGAGLDTAVLDTFESGQFRAVDLSGVTLSAEVEEQVAVQRTYNLLARIPGTDRPDETVLYSAHWDHVGTRETPDSNGDTIYNGAWDNASGTVGVVEVARAMAAAPRPARSIVFAHMTAEEQGLLGAFWYAANPVWPLETTVADINIDMLPLSAPTRDLAIFGFGQNTLEDDLGALAVAEGRVVTGDREPDQNYFYRSDHFPYALKGVPTLMPWHGVDLDEGGVEVGLPAYQALFRAHYHQRSDEWREDYDLSSAVENLVLLTRLGLDLANSDRWPDWKPGSEFAATRATSADSRRVTE
jgi:hypothetical protein